MAKSFPDGVGEGRSTGLRKSLTSASTLSNFAIRSPTYAILSAHNLNEKSIYKGCVSRIAHDVGCLT